MLCRNLPRPGTGSRWPIAGSEPSNSDEQLPAKQALTATFHGLLCSSRFWNGFPPPFLPPSACNTLLRGHSYSLSEDDFLAGQRQCFLMRHLRQNLAGCSRIPEMALTILFLNDERGRG